MFFYFAPYDGLAHVYTLDDFLSLLFFTHYNISSCCFLLALNSEGITR